MQNKPVTTARIIYLAFESKLVETRLALSLVLRLQTEWT